MSSHDWEPEGVYLRGLRRRLAGLTVVPLAGAMEIERYPVFHQAFARVAAFAQPLVLDLTRVTRIDSTFLTELLLVVRRRSEKHLATVVALDNPAILRIITLARVEDRLTIVPCVAAATRLIDDLARADVRALEA